MTPLFFIARRASVAVLCAAACSGALASAHSADAEYVLIDSIPPRLYLVTRMVMDIARGKLTTS